MHASLLSDWNKFAEFCAQRFNANASFMRPATDVTDGPAHSLLLSSHLSARTTALSRAGTAIAKRCPRWDTYEASVDTSFV
jgi:hypothetical protein